MLDFKIFIAPESEAILAQCQGNNKKKLLVVYESAEKNENLEHFLAKILKAVQHDIVEDVLLLRIQPEQTFSLTTLCQSQDIAACLVFGITGKRMGWHAHYPDYQPFRFRRINFLMVDALDRVEGSVDLKKRLWGALKKMFL